MNSIEICAGAGGQALGLEQAGFEHLALVEIDVNACDTLRLNRPAWNIIQMDVKNFSASEYRGIDLLAGGVPCPPFSKAGKQLGHEDERDLFPEALRLIEECNPKAVMIENVRGLLDPKFKNYREEIHAKLKILNYECEWKLLNSCDYSVSQLRPRSILVAMKPQYFKHFKWPNPIKGSCPNVGSLLYNEMKANGWSGAADWAEKANGIAPTLVGGSKKHGGADLGPTRAKLAWAKLHVDGSGVADAPPCETFVGRPKLTVKMASLIQGFPPDWSFSGKKTSAYRQIGNAFPPPVAKAVGLEIKRCLDYVDSKKEKENI